MGTRPALVGVVSATRTLGSLTMLAGLASSLPVALGSTGGLSAPGIAVVAVVIFGVPFGWFGGPRRRAWYQERLDRAAPVPYGATVVAREDAFEAVSRPLTVPLLTGLILGLFIAFCTGVPAGLALAGVGGGMLSRAQWLAREERRLGTFLLCPQAPLRVEANDPALSVYRQVPFYTAPEKTAADQD